MRCETGFRAGIFSLTLQSSYASYFDCKKSVLYCPKLTEVPDKLTEVVFLEPFKDTIKTVFLFPVIHS